MLLNKLKFKKYSLAEISRNILPILFASVGFGIIGLIDDFKKVVLKNGLF